MISVIIPTLNDEAALLGTLGSLVSAAADGAVRDVIIADGGSADHTEAVADAGGCVFLAGPKCRGDRLAEAARRAKGPWLLFLSPGVEPEEGWYREARQFIERTERGGGAGSRAAAFRFTLDHFGTGARLGERLVRLRGALVGQRLEEQGLLIHRSFYEALGGFRGLPAMEGVDMARRIGLRRLVRLRSGLLVRPQDHARSGEFGLGARRALSFGLLALRVPPRLIARLHG
jgi:hypothetical protein